MQKIVEKTFTAELVSENSYTATPLGKHESTMTLYAEPGMYFIEWDIPTIETVQIGLVFEHKTLVDYDGVFDLPKEAVELLRSAGFTVPADMLPATESI